MDWVAETKMESMQLIYESNEMLAMNTVELHPVEGSVTALYVETISDGKFSRCTAAMPEKQY